ncbi:hypothetical protein DLAC_08338 [Tieghemostelium lacteum]|uniref:RRM domain-containing protein n=1 Tax=Tieghemostelium lacteum TaxID=361077 RepID=A0A151ZBQ7_TIELA|nr:hypothetical protein DLAC_08338 [Tieghemostelium lacteum]|eukprot:KYQ91382.1 hypothetical protein DLAC_08338 [Tieghemostelium lacteum]
MNKIHNHIPQQQVPIHHIQQQQQTQVNNNKIQNIQPTNQVHSSSPTSSSSSTNIETPSAVLHLRSLPTQTKDSDIYQLTSDLKVGRCVAIRILEKHQALLEMDSIEAATRVYQYAQNNVFCLYGKPIQISYSRSKTINQQPSGNVLLCTIENPGMNTINVDHLHHIFLKYGEVFRIVIFNKTSLQALIEFSNSDAANNAKKHLNNVPIFQNNQGTLRIEISKTEKLNVMHNTEKTKDFTKPLPTILPPYFQQNFNQPQMPSPTVIHNFNNTHSNNSNNINHHQQQAHHQNIHHLSTVQQHQHQHQQQSHHQQQQQVLSQQHHNHQQQTVNNNINNSNMMVNNGNGLNRTSVLLVHGLDEDVMNCDRIFNLFSIYGNVLKIKILSTKKGAAMVQMEDSQQAETAIRYYHQLSMFGEALQIHYSKHLTITDSHNPDSPNLSKDFTGSPLNRFSHPINTYKHIYKPSPTLYFSNVPKDFTEASFNQLFASLNTHKPIAIKNFSLPGSSSNTVTSSPSTTTTTNSNTNTSSTSNNNSTTANNNNNNNTSSTTTSNSTSIVNGSSSNTTQDPKHTDKIVGLIEFSSLSNALEALVLANNIQPANSHYTIRLSFSNSSVLPHTPKTTVSSPITNNNTVTTQNNSSSSTPTQNNNNIMNNTTSPKAHH